MGSVDQLQQLPESVKRNILARLFTPNVEAEVPVLQVDDAASADDPQQQGLAQQLSSRQVSLPQMNGQASVVDGVLSQVEVQAVAAAVEAWVAQHGRRPGMGSNASGGLWHDTSYRGDINCWVTAPELQAAGQPLLAACLQMLAGLRKQLAAQGFDVGGRISCQLACYPGKGARYVRHTDASDSAPDRSVTALLYLNHQWDAQVDGGQLALYNAACSKHSLDKQQPNPGSSTLTSQHNDGDTGIGYLAGEPALLVAPTGGRLLVFDSRLPHEVLPAHKTRLSITAWFCKGKQQAPAAAAATTAEGVMPAHDVGCPPAPATPAVPFEPAGLGAAACSSQPKDLPAAPTTVTATAAAAGIVETPTAAVDGGSVASTGSLPRIFVSIAAFRDAECQWTTRDLFTKAAHPDRVFVGVVWQIDPVADAGFVRMAGGSRTAQYLRQVREVRCHYSTATGPCAARSMAQQLWAGEEYVLQIDAHMRLVQDWDILCIRELQAAQQAAGHPSVVLSTYPLGYDGEGPAAAVPDAAPAMLLCAQEVDETGLLRVQSRCLKERPSSPLPSNFWAAGFSFAPSRWLLDVPYCPHLAHLFFGEEQYMLLRMWTRGWDVYAPTQPLAFHQWERKARANSYQACVKIDADARAASQQRVLQLVQPSDAQQAVRSHPAATPSAATNSAVIHSAWHRAQPPTAQDWAVGGVWGLGTTRTVQQFEQQAGVSFAQATLQPRATYGGQPKESFAE